MGKILLSIGCFMLHFNIATAKSAEPKRGEVSRKPASKSCEFFRHVDGTQWLLRIEGIAFMTVKDDQDGKAKLAEVARDLAQAGICQF